MTISENGVKMYNKEQIKRGIGSRAARVGIFLLTCALAAHAQIPDYFADPGEGEDFDGDKFTLTFIQQMEETINIEFDTPGVVWNCAWLQVLPSFPRILLECTVASGTLEPESTVTFTVNKDGSGFTTMAGKELATSTGTFVIPADGGDSITVTPNPASGSAYDPNAGVPVIFQFNMPMVEIDLNVAVAFDVGEWSCAWRGNSIIECTLEGAVDPGSINYTLTGFTSLSGTTLDTFAGSLIIEDEVTGVTIFPFPMSGETFDPIFDQEIRFTFTSPMDQSVDAQAAVSFNMGTWSCRWTSGFSLNCSPIGDLPPGTYEYNLIGLKTADGTTLDPFTGTFLVESDGNGGMGGTPAPDCPEGSTPVALPKTIWVCGDDIPAWDDAVVFPRFNGNGFSVAGSSLTDRGTLQSLVLLDASGNATAKVRGVDALTSLTPAFSEGTVFADQSSTLSQTVTFGLFTADGDTTSPIFVNQIDLQSTQSRLEHFAEGRTTLVVNDIGKVLVALFESTGALAWAKEYSSDLFATEPSQIQVVPDTQTASLIPYPESGFFLSVTTIETTVSGTDFQTVSTLTLIRLDSSGNIIWSRSLTSSSGLDVPMATLAADGTINLQIVETDLSNPFMPSFSSVLCKIDANANPIWTRRYDGIIVNIRDNLQNGASLITGNLSDLSDRSSSAFFAIADELV